MDLDRFTCLKDEKHEELWDESVNKPEVHQHQPPPPPGHTSPVAAPCVQPRPNHLFLGNDIFHGVDALRGCMELFESPARDADRRAFTEFVDGVVTFQINDGHLVQRFEGLLQACHSRIDPRKSFQRRYFKLILSYYQHVQRDLPAVLVAMLDDFL